jgi:hypothetical protein
MRLFSSFLNSNKRDWVLNYFKPKSIYSTTIFIAQFLKHWGPRIHRYEDTFQDLMTTLQEKILLTPWKNHSKRTTCLVSNW